MTELNRILAEISAQKTAPVEKWNPEVCGEIDIQILKDGQWLHEGRPFSRISMVKLFASLLKLEEDQYYLVTPVEKLRIRVEDTPFVVIASELIDDSWVITSNLDEKQLLNIDHPLDTSDPDSPKLIWRNNLPARVQQNVMYQWQMHALDHGGFDGESLWLKSGDSRFLLDRVSERSD